MLIKLTKFLCSENLENPDHKREKDQWSRIVSAMPRCKLVKVVWEHCCWRDFWKSCLRIYEKQTCNPQSKIVEVVSRIFEKQTRNLQVIIAEEVLRKTNCGSSFEKSWKADPQSATNNCGRKKFLQIAEREIVEISLFKVHCRKVVVQRSVADTTLQKDRYRRLTAERQFAKIKMWKVHCRMISICEKVVAKMQLQKNSFAERSLWKGNLWKVLNNEFK